MESEKFCTVKQQEEQVYVPNSVGKRLNLYLTALAVNVSSFAVGIAFGWTAPMLPVLQAADSPVGPISDIEASWLASITSLPRLVAIPFFMYTINRFGRKKTGCMVAAPLIISSMMVLFATSFAVLVTARFITGIGVGGVVILIPAYVSDISEDANKGELGALYGLLSTIGITATYALGYYISYTAFQIFCMAFPVIFVCGLYWLPESPIFLLISGKSEEAKEALQWLRNGDECALEFERLELRAEEVLYKMTHKVSFSTMMDRPTVRALLIGLGLIANQQFSGIAVILSYTTNIFEEAGSTIPPSLCTIIVGVVTLAGTIVSSVMIERCGRRIILLTSDIILSVSLGVLGTYFYLNHLGWDVKSFGWLPLASLSAYIFSFGLGFSSIPFTITTELVNSHVRGAIQTIILVFLSILMYVLVFCYIPLTHAIGTYGCFWFFAGSCAFGTVCIFFVMPETKNRSLEDLISQMNSNNYFRSVLCGGKNREEIELSKI